MPPFALLLMSMPYDAADASYAPLLCSIDGHPLEIKKLRGEEPVESIDLSCNGLCVGSAVIIASLIVSNTATTSLKYDATQTCSPSLSTPADVSIRLFFAASGATSSEPRAQSTSQRVSLRTGLSHRSSTPLAALFPPSGPADASIRLPFAVSTSTSSGLREQSMSLTCSRSTLRSWTSSMPLYALFPTVRAR